MLKRTKMIIYKIMYKFWERKEVKIRGSQSSGCMVGDKTLPIKKVAGTSFLQMPLSRRKTMPDDNNTRPIS